jgi:hypothetical protein
LANVFKDLRRLQTEIMREVFETSGGVRDDNASTTFSLRQQPKPRVNAGVSPTSNSTFDDFTESTQESQRGSPALNGVRSNKQYGSIQQSKASSEKAHKPTKELSLRQLRDIMTSVYSAKLQDDARRADLEEPLVTMETFLYSFLGKRYGLKSVVHEWSTAIFRTIQKYAQSEMDVMVFGKILQNKLAESFASVQDTVRATVQMLLKKNIEQRHPSRCKPELDELWRSLLKAVPRQECVEVVRYMYNERDCEIVLERLEQASHLAKAESQDGSSELECIPYKAFLRILLSFQMNLTEGFLTDFQKFFREIDQTGHGTLNPIQLEELVQRLATEDLQDSRGNPGEEEARQHVVEVQNEVLAQIRQVRSATFSESVDLCTPLISARWELLGEQPLALK